MKAGGRVNAFPFAQAVHDVIHLALLGFMAFVLGKQGFWRK
jgi:hypothetical protein